LKAVGMTSVLHPSQQTFTRSTAASRLNGKLVAPQVLRLEQGAKRGLAPFIEEATTNLVTNSGFESVTGTATVFSDTLAEHTGIATPAPWTLVSGGFSFGTNICQPSSDNSMMITGNPNWKPIIGSGGQSLGVTAQATFTTPPTLTGKFSVNLMSIGSAKPALANATMNNRYYAELNMQNGNLYIAKSVDGSESIISTSKTLTVTANAPYTIQLFVDSDNNLSATIYSGQGTGGADLGNVGIVDNTFAGNYYALGVGGDTGVNISDASVTAPFADGWTVGGDSRVAWALTTNAISGNYSVDAVDSGINGYIYNTTDISGLAGNTSYTLSAFTNGSVVGAPSPILRIEWKDSSGTDLIPASTNVPFTPTSTTTRIFNSAISPANTAKITVWIITGGSAGNTANLTVDAIQLEQKAYATTYVENNSASAGSTATRNADSLIYNLSQPLPSRWAGAFVYVPQQASSVNTVNTTRELLCVINPTAPLSTQVRYVLNYQGGGAFKFSKQLNGTTLATSTVSGVTFNAGDSIFIECEDDPTVVGGITLRLSVNSGTVQKSFAAETTALNDAQTVYLGCFTSLGYEANGTIEATIHELAANETITDDMVQALFSASVWGGGDYPSPQKYDGEVIAVTSEGATLQSAGGGGYWEARMAPNGAYAFQVLDANGNPLFGVAPDGRLLSGSNQEVNAQVLSGGYKIQSGTVTFTATNGAVTEQPVTFPNPYSTAPLVFVEAVTSYPQNFPLGVVSQGVSGFGIEAYSSYGSNVSLTVNWFAIGTA
jgi:hypothetical protein